MSKKADSREKHAAKKASVLGGGKRKNTKNVVLMAVCAALVIGGGIFFVGRKGEDVPPAAKVFAPAVQTGEVTYPVAQFDDGQCRFFEHTTADGLTLRYFVLKSSDGVIRSAFDACDSCWKAGKGYRQVGDDMVCQNCRMKFASVKVMEVKGGCNPSPLPNQVRDGKVVIRVADILAGRPYFELPPKEG